MTTSKATFYRDARGTVARIRHNSDGSASVTVYDASGRAIFGKCYGSPTGAKRALRKFGSQWKAQK